MNLHHDAVRFEVQGLKKIKAAAEGHRGLPPCRLVICKKWTFAQLNLLICAKYIVPRIKFGCA